MILGLTLTALGTYALIAINAGTDMYYFQAYHSPTVILASTMAFLLLLTVKPPIQQQINPLQDTTTQQEKIMLQQEKLFLQQTTPLLQQPPITPQQQKAKTAICDKLMAAISQNTLGIFFVHIIVLETIQQGYLGFMLNHETLNPIIGVPLLTVATLFISLGIILLLNKIGLKKITGSTTTTTTHNKIQRNTKN